MLFSGVQWSDSGIRIYIIYTCSFLFFSIIGYKTIKKYSLEKQNHHIPLTGSRVLLCHFGIGRQNDLVGLLLLRLLSRFGRVGLCATPEMAAHQASLSLGFSRQEHWSGLPFPSPMRESEKWKWSRSVVSDSSRPHGLQPTGLLRPWDFLGKSTGVGCHCLLRW